MKNILKKIIVTGIAAITALGLLAGVTAAADADALYRTVDEIKESGTVNIGVFSDKSPGKLSFQCICQKIDIRECFPELSPLS